VENPNAVSQGIASITVNGIPLPTGETRILLLDNLQDSAITHRVKVMLG